MPNLQASSTSGCATRVWSGAAATGFPVGRSKPTTGVKRARVGTSCGLVTTGHSYSPSHSAWCPVRPWECGRSAAVNQEAKMFVQVITGTTSDREGLLRQADRWQDELRPG